MSLIAISVVEDQNHHTYISYKFNATVIGNLLQRSKCYWQSKRITSTQHDWFREHCREKPTLRCSIMYKYID